MFGPSRRHRPPAQPLTKETANPSAATAAASAFMRRDASTSLSSAAAAAALKARPTTPTDVAQVQSKRAARRSASVSSSGSRDRGRTGLHRSPSSGSMTERTFRSPSPARSAAPNSDDIPPLPSIPKNEHIEPAAGVPKAPTHKKTISVQTQPFRTASQKMKDGFQGTWFGAAAAGDMSHVRHSSIDSANMRPSSPNSINFSYPRTSSEIAAAGLTRSASVASDRTMVYDPNSRRMIPRAESLMREQRVRDASQKTPKKKKHEPSKSGSHLAKGTVGRVKGTAVELPAASTSNVVQTSTGGEIPVNNEVSTEKDVHELHQEEENIPESHAPKLVGKQVAIAEIPEVSAATNEEPPQEQRVEAQLPIHEDEEPREDAGLGYDDQRTTQEQKSTAVYQAPTVPVPSAHVNTNSVVPESGAEISKRDSVPRQQTEGVRPARMSSISPVRTTHFAPSADQLLVRHEPPPRSLSPRKSAMKHSSPTRDLSPSESGSEASGALMSPPPSDDGGLSRKKSVRVSFDQHAVLVGEAAELVPEEDADQDEEEETILSPQTKKAWHNIIGRNKKDSVVLDEDEKMTPRPALPSFGSIREKKVKEPEERPLVRPSDHTYSPPDQGVSNDAVVGSILSQEYQAARNAANISRLREPLPPVVTSVENDMSDNTLSDDDDSTMDEPATTDPDTTVHEEGNIHQNGSVAKTKDVTEATKQGELVPTISIIQASPRVIDEENNSPHDFFDLPEDFPTDADTTPAKTAEPRIGQETQEPTERVKVQKPAPIITDRAVDSTTMSPPSPQIHDIQEEPEESDESSIYSDAYEDLSDLEGDGFMSLAAIVDTPVEAPVSHRLLEKAIAKSKSTQQESQESAPTAVEAPAPLQTPSDWDNAKAYWRSLSIDKRRQLEREALEEAGEDADLEEIAQETERAKKRRSLDRPAGSAPSAKSQDPSRVYQIQPGTAWPENEVQKPHANAIGAKLPSGGSKLRKSMRGEAAAVPAQTAQPQPNGKMRKSMRSGTYPSSGSEDGHMRTSLRTGPSGVATSEGTMRKSLRTGGAAAEDGHKKQASGRKAARPASYQMVSAAEPPMSAAPTRPVSMAAGASGSSVKPTLRRKGSDSSESSFRRTRPQNEGFGFQSTMRGTLREPTRPGSDNGKGSSRFSLRSLSPTGSAFRRNSGTVSPPPAALGGRMKASLRPESSDGSTSRMRMSGFGRGSKPKKEKGAKKGKGSRFADSSDEEDAPRGFRSRFADSSDEDEVPRPRSKGNSSLPKTMRSATSSSAVAMTMGTPAPRLTQEEEEDSPDLPDSDDDLEPPPQTAAGPYGATPTQPTTGLNRSGSGREVLASGPAPAGPRPAHTRRGSLMSILRRKKDSGGKISRNHGESATRRDTPLERSAEQLAVIRSPDSRLQKRRGGSGSGNWPLGDEEVDRPSTATGPPVPGFTNVGPGQLKRRSTSPGIRQLSEQQQQTAGTPAMSWAPDSAAHEDQLQQQQSQQSQQFGSLKKKKFGSLRKMFGLHD